MVSLVLVHHIEEVSYSCGATFDDSELLGRLANVCIKDHQCTNPIEKLYYSCDFEYICVHCGKEDQLQVDNDYFPQCQECQNVDRVKRPAKNTDVCMFHTFICPRVYGTNHPQLKQSTRATRRRHAKDTRDTRRKHA